MPFGPLFVYFRGQWLEWPLLQPMHVNKLICEEKMAGKINRQFFEPLAREPRAKVSKEANPGVQKYKKMRHFNGRQNSSVVNLLMH